MADSIANGLANAAAGVEDIMLQQTLKDKKSAIKSVLDRHNDVNFTPPRSRGFLPTFMPHNVVEVNVPGLLFDHAASNPTQYSLNNIDSWNWWKSLPLTRASPAVMSFLTDEI